jgi:hypothetical protein
MMIEVTHIGPLWTAVNTPPAHPGRYSVIRNVSDKNIMAGGYWDGFKWLDNCLCEMSNVSHWAPISD